ncbi:MAG: DUF4838 domain-containing protein, partial [Candidatus Sumerlaeota bacterium]|nr:DUF4838 domain-containing protein [Candidatus Sumerlaeota bacterium]
PRGMLYAVYVFLEDVVGCRWWTSDESFIPRKPTLEIAPLDISYAPPLRCREAFYRDAFNGVFAARLRLNGHSERIAPEYGGHYSILGWCHTFYQLLPPARFFAQHPDWYSEIGGKRTGDGAQLCLANAEMRAELVRQALVWIRKDPGAGMISISQNDWEGRCQCAQCKAAEAEESAASGPLIRFVNAVAEEIEKEYPEFLVETLAYQYTRQPPRLARPRKNVIVRLCTIECSFVQPLSAGAHNEAFRKDIEGWSAIAPNLYVWDYVTNFSNYLLPHPNLRALAPNVRFFAEHHTIGLFEQGDAGSGIGDFVRLRAWLLAHLMWNPKQDEKHLTREFLNGYYGAAGPFLEQYLDLMNGAAERSGVYLRCFMNGTDGWLTLETANRAWRLFDSALKAVAGDAALERRVRRERLPLDLVWLERHRGFKSQARRSGAEFLGSSDPAAACEEFLRVARLHKPGEYAEGRPFEPYADALKARFMAGGTPPEPCRGLAADDWLDAQEGALTLAELGKWVFVAPDAAASNGKAAHMPATHNQWAIQWPFSDDQSDGSRWRCYIAARCDAKTSTASAQAAKTAAMAIGIYDGKARKSLAGQELKIEDLAGPNYRLFDLGAHDLRRGVYLWAAPRENPQNVSAVWVDRMFIVREKDR